MKKSLLIAVFFLCAMCLNPLPVRAEAGRPQMTVLYASYLDFLMDLPIAIEEGYFRELGLDLKALDIPASPTRNAMLAKEEMDGAFLPSQAALTFVEKGLKLTMVSGIGNRGFDFAVLSDSPIKSIEDFHGKTIASVPNPSNPRLALDYDMKRLGIAAEVLSTKTDADRLSMLLSRQVDVALSSPAIEARLGDDIRLVHTTSTSKYLWNSCGWFFKPEYIEKNREAVRLFVAGLEKARKLIHDNPQRAIEIYSKYNRLKDDDYKKPFILAEFDVPAKVYGYGLRKTYEMMREFDLLRGEIDIDAMLTGDFAAMVAGDY